MSTDKREALTIYYACTRALERVDQLKDRKSGRDFSPTLHMERQSYVDLANEIAADNQELAPVQ